MAPSAAGTESSIDFETLSVFGSIRSTLPSFPHSTHTEPSPLARLRGRPATSTRLSTTLVAGLIFRILFCSGQASQRAVSANIRLLQPTGRRISATTTFFSGSIRASVSRASVSSQMLSELAAMEPLISAAPLAIVAVIFEVFASIRCRAPSPQVGTQRLPKADTMPPQGFFRPASGSPGLLVRVSILSSLSPAGMKRVPASGPAGAAGVPPTPPRPPPPPPPSPRKPPRPPPVAWLSARKNTQDGLAGAGSVASAVTAENAI